MHHTKIDTDSPSSSNQDDDDDDKDDDKLQTSTSMSLTYAIAAIAAANNDPRLCTKPQLTAFSLILWLGLWKQISFFLSVSLSF